jgi:hypothetical protein
MSTGSQSLSQNLWLNPTDIRRNKIAICIGLTLVSIMLFFCIKDGYENNDIMLRFGEHKAVTMVSGLYMGATAMTSLAIFLIKRRSGQSLFTALFWLLSAMGFFFLTMDEYFMFHEGMDNYMGYVLVKQDIKHLNLDNLPLAFYGILALSICYYFRGSVLQHPAMFPGLILGGMCLFGTVLFHSLERIHMAYEVTEESFKMVGVVFFYIAYYLGLLSALDQLKLTKN